MLAQLTQPVQRDILDRMVSHSVYKLERSCLGPAAQGLSSHQLAGGRWNFFCSCYCQGSSKNQGKHVTTLPKNLYQVYSVKGKKEGHCSVCMEKTTNQGQMKTKN